MSVDTDNIATDNCPSKEEMDAKKATIIRLRKNARATGESRHITNFKIKAIREHDMSRGSMVHCASGACLYAFKIRK